MRKTFALFVSHALVQKGAEELISGHVQVALKTAHIIQELGHSATVITNGEGDTLPGIGSESVKFIKLPSLPLFNKFGRLQSAFQFLVLPLLLKKHRINAIITIGGPRSALLAAMMKFPCPSIARYFIVTNVDTGLMKSKLIRRCLARFDGVIALTQYTQDRLRDSWGIESFLARPGIIKPVELGTPLFQKQTILYWRYGTLLDGADIAIAAFSALAPRFPDTFFVFAVAGWSPFKEEMQQLAKDHENIKFFCTPYENFKIGDLLAAADICVIPFRQTTIDPQISLLECLIGGTPVISTAIGSIPEVILDGQNGLILKEFSDLHLAEVLESMLKNPERVERLRSKTAAATKAKWNWENYKESIRNLLEAGGE